MCHGKIAPKSSSEFVVTSVGHGVFLQLVILCALLGDGLASGKWMELENILSEVTQTQKDMHDKGLTLEDIVYLYGEVSILILFTIG